MLTNKATIIFNNNNNNNNNYYYNYYYNNNNHNNMPDSNKHLAVEEAVDLVEHLLRYDHLERYTCQEAMAHPYFEPIRKV